MDISMWYKETVNHWFINSELSDERCETKVVNKILWLWWHRRQPNGIIIVRIVNVGQTKRTEENIHADPLEATCKSNSNIFIIMMMMILYDLGCFHLSIIIFISFDIKFEGFCSFRVFIFISKIDFNIKSIF